MEEQQKEESGASSQTEQLAVALSSWLDCLHEWYPDLHTRTYFLPPVYFKRVPYKVATLSGLSVLVPQPTSNLPSPPPALLYPAHPYPGPQTNPDVPLAGCVWPPLPSTPFPLPKVLESDVRNDIAIERVLHCLRVLSEEPGEVMMVISELEFRRYLDNQTDPITKAACALLRRPAALDQKFHDGDFDVLIVHRTHGLIVGEVKSVGAFVDNGLDLSQTVVTRVYKALRQLDKASEVLRSIVSDLASFRVIKTLILPNITSHQLLQVLKAKEQFGQDLCQCLDSPDVSTAVAHCLCADQMPSTEDLYYFTTTKHLTGWALVRRAVSSHLPWLLSRLQSPSSTAASCSTYSCSSSSSSSASSPVFCRRFLTSGLSSWWRMMLASGPDPCMSAEAYELILARLCGPATTVRVPIVTRPRKLVRSLCQAVAETGLLQATLALYPDQVDLLSKPQSRVYLNGPPGCGKTVLLVLKAQQWLNQGHSVHIVSISEDAQAVSILIENQLRGLVGVTSSEKEEGEVGGVEGDKRVFLHQFDLRKMSAADDLHAVVERLKVFSNEQCPLCVIVDEVVRALRTMFVEFCRLLYTAVPTVSIWAAGIWRTSFVPPWLMHVETLRVPLRCPPAVHREVAQSGYVGSSSVPSYLCPPSPVATDGPQIMWLRHNGQAWHKEGVTSDCEVCGRNVAQVLMRLHVGAKESDLHYRDVLILCHRPSEELGMVRALRARNVPVAVLRKEDTEEAMRDVALAISDRVTLTSYMLISGLERRVVVGMEPRLYGRLAGMSRCTAQLVWIDPPSGHQGS